MADGNFILTQEGKDKLEEELPCFRFAHVKSYASLVPIPRARVGVIVGLGRLARDEALYLYHLGSVIGEQPCRKGARKHPGEIEDPYSIKRFHACPHAPSSTMAHGMRMS